MKGYGGIEELEEGEDAWVFFPVTLESRDGEIGRMTDFLYKNVRDIHQLAVAVSNGTEFHCVNHDSGGHEIEIIDYGEEQVKIAFDPGKEVWIQKEALKHTLTKILNLLDIVVRGVNQEVASKIEIREKLDEVEAL